MYCMLSQTVLILILCLSPLLCQSQECSKSCISNKDQKGDPQEWKSRCLQFYEQKNTVTFDNTTCSKWDTVYEGLSTIFLKIFHLSWRSLESKLKGAKEDSCSKNTLGTHKDFAQIFNNKISRLDLVPTNRFCHDGEMCNLRPTCPIGLITSVLCLFGLDTVCNNADTVQSCGAMPFICPYDIQAVIRLCLDDDLHNETFESLLKIMPVSSNGACSPPHFIYLGQPSNRVLPNATIVVTCISVDTAELSCFNGGQRVESVTWKKNGTPYPSTTDSIATIKVQDGDHQLVNGNYTCFSSGDEIVTANIKIHCHYEEVTEDFPDEDEWPTEASLRNTEEFQNLWTNESVWSEADLTDINALDNMDFYSGYLSVVQIAVNGRLTPVCGEDWNMVAANVFCNELGVRNNMSWNATFVGTIPRTHDTINPHYNPYIRDIDCKGGEAHLIYCNHTGWGSKNCQHHAVVICEEVNEIPPSPGISLVIGFAITAVGVLFFGVVVALLWRYWKRCRHNKPDNSVIVLYNPTGATTGTTEADGQSTTEHPPTDATEPPQSSAINSDFSFVMPHTLQPVMEIKYLVRSVLKQDPPVLMVDVIRMEGTMKVIAKEHKEGKEYSILKELDHLNIVKTLLSPANVTVDKFQENKSPRVFMFFIEYYDLGDLDQYLSHKGQGHNMTRDNMYSIVLGLAKALEYLHSKKIVHGDVTADNVVLHSEKDKLIPKLTDFGCSFKTSDTPSVPWGTWLYMAPELLIGDGDLRYPIKSDIYSFGMLIWEVLSWMACDANKSRPRHVSATSNDSGIQTGETGSTILTLSDVTEADVELLELSNPYISDYNTSCGPSTQVTSMFVNTSEKTSGCRLKVHNAMIEQLQRNRDMFSVPLQQGKLTSPTKDVMVTFYNQLQDTLPTPNTHGWDSKCFPWAVDVIENCSKEVAFRCSAKNIIKLIEERSLYLRKDS